MTDQYQYVSSLERPKRRDLVEEFDPDLNEVEEEYPDFSDPEAFAESDALAEKVDRATERSEVDPGGVGQDPEYGERGVPYGGYDVNYAAYDAVPAPLEEEDKSGSSKFGPDQTARGGFKPDYNSAEYDPKIDSLGLLKKKLRARARGRISREDPRASELLYSDEAKQQANKRKGTVLGPRRRKSRRRMRERVPALKTTRRRRKRSAVDVEVKSTSSPPPISPTQEEQESEKVKRQLDYGYVKKHCSYAPKQECKQVSKLDS